MVTHDPIAASYADRVVFLADGQIVDELRDPNRGRHPRQDAQAGRVDPCGRSRVKGLIANKLRFAAHRIAVIARRRVHLGHARAHRDDPADVRRPVREHRQGHRRAWCAARRRSAATSGSRRTPADDSRVAGRDGRRTAPGRRGRARQRRRSTTRRSSDKNGKAIGNPGQGPPTLGFGWIPVPRAQPVPPRRGRAPAAARRRDRHRQGTAPTRAKLHVGDRGEDPHRRSPPKSYTIVGIARFGTADSLAGASVVAVHAARGAAASPNPGKVRRHRHRRQAGRVARRGRSATSRRRLGAARPGQHRGRSPARQLTEENQDAIDKQLRFFNIGPADLRVRRAHRRRVHHLQHVLDRRRATHPRDGVAARDRREPRQVIGQIIGESLVRRRDRVGRSASSAGVAARDRAARR